MPSQPCCFQAYGEAACYGQTMWQHSVVHLLAHKQRKNEEEARSTIPSGHTLNDRRTPHQPSLKGFRPPQGPRLQHTQVFWGQLKYNLNYSTKELFSDPKHHHHAISIFIDYILFIKTTNAYILPSLMRQSWCSKYTSTCCRFQNFIHHRTHLFLF